MIYLTRNLAILSTKAISTEAEVAGRFLDASASVQAEAGIARNHKGPTGGAGVPKVAVASEGRGSLI